jgi:hypothetical protein
MQNPVVALISIQFRWEMMFGRGYANQNQVVKGISKTTHNQGVPVATVASSVDDARKRRMAITVTCDRWFTALFYDILASCAWMWVGEESEVHTIVSGGLEIPALSAQDV